MIRRRSCQATPLVLFIIGQGSAQSEPQRKDAVTRTRPENAADRHDQKVVSKQAAPTACHRVPLGRSVEHWGRVSM